MKYGNEIIEFLFFYGWLISLGAMSKIDMIATYFSISLFWPVLWTGNYMDRE